MKILLLATLVALGSCKARKSISSEKSIVDSSGRIFGLIPSPGQGASPTKFEFRLCNEQANRRPMELVINDPNVCINPYLDAGGNPLVISGQVFNRIDEAEASLRSRGFRKGAAAAVGGVAVGAAGGLVIGVASGVFIELAFATMVPGTMLMFAGSSAAGAGAGGVLSYAIWGATDRDTANNIGAIMGDFNRREKADDVVRVLRNFGEEMKWSVVREVDIEQSYDSRESLERQRDTYTKGDNLPKDDIGAGVNVCMRKYGIWLHNQSFYSYVYRSSVCGDYCGNPKTRETYFRTKTSEIFPNESDRNWCRSANGMAGTSDAVRSCAVMCCDQDIDCADDAMKRAGF